MPGWCAVFSGWGVTIGLFYHYGNQGTSKEMPLNGVEFTNSLALYIVRACLWMIMTCTVESELCHAIMNQQTMLVDFQQLDLSFISLAYFGYCNRGLYCYFNAKSWSSSLLWKYAYAVLSDCYNRLPSALATSFFVQENKNNSLIDMYKISLTGITVIILCTVSVLG